MSFANRHFHLSDLYYYFDSIERERMDNGGLSRKVGEWLALRNKLVKLPDPAFEVVIQSIHSLLDTVSTEKLEKSDEKARIEERKRAMALFQRVAQAEPRSYTNGHSVAETSQVVL
ncbi:MAG: hypothetical protein R3B45_06340 [Bdellovibrionota bacterium]